MLINWFIILIQYFYYKMSINESKLLKIIGIA